MIKQENFFVDDEYYHDIELLEERIISDSLLQDKDLDEIEDHVLALPDDWQLEVCWPKLEPLFQIDHRDLQNMAEALCDYHDDRFNPDHAEDHRAEILKVLEACLNVEAFNAGIPKLWYGEGGEDGVITKQDLVDYYKAKKNE